jgi:hypothetical protein
MRLARSRWRLDDFESLAVVDRVAEFPLEVASLAVDLVPK